MRWPPCARTRIAGLPDDIAHQRMLLEARALAALKQWDQALDLIAVDDAADTRRLRADIYWESGNWAVAAQKAEELLGNRWSDPEPLTAEERHEVMRAAIAYSLANDEPGLERLRDHFAAKMKASPDASAFAVVTQRIDTQGVAFRDVAGKIASIDTLESFMTDFKKRYDARRRDQLNAPQSRSRLVRASAPIRSSQNSAWRATSSQPGSAIGQWLKPSSSRYCTRPR